MKVKKNTEIFVFFAAAFLLLLTFYINPREVKSQTLSPTPSPTPIPCTLLGDANGDGKVDNLDYQIWLTYHDQTTTNGCPNADFNGDGLVNGIDYVIWLNNYGKTISPTSTPTSTPIACNNPFVKACGTRLCINNAPYYPYGASFYGSSSQSGINNIPGLIGLAQIEHLNAIRLVNFYHTGSGTDPSITPYDPTTWAKVDNLLVSAANANMKVLLDFADYKNILWNHCINPWTYNWHPFLSFVASRVNTLSGKLYVNDPTIFMVSFAGDLHKVPATYTYTDADGISCSINLTADMYTTFYADVESYWKTLDTNHLTTAGGVAGMEYSGQNGIPWQAIYSNPANDVCGTKTYGGMFNFIPTLADYCNNTLHKPWFDDEWGKQQSDGDATRSAEFQAQFDNNKTYNAAGDFFWNAGYQISSTTYDVNPQTPLTMNTVIQNVPVLPPSSTCTP